MHRWLLICRVYMEWKLDASTPMHTSDGLLETDE